MAVGECLDVVHDVGMGALQVEVFPLSSDRWVAVIESFSTEAASPDSVSAEVAASIRTVLGWDAPFVLVDENGDVWSPAQAEEQLLRMAGAGTPESPVARAEGRCGACQHEWSMHPIVIGHIRFCAMCIYEEDREDRSEEDMCEQTPPQLQVLASRYVTPRLARDRLLRHKVQLVRSGGQVWLELPERTWSHDEARRLLAAAEREVSTALLPVLWRKRRAF